MLNINDTSHWITRSDLNLALKFLLCLDIIMNPLFHTDFSISDSLKNFRKSVLIYETIISHGNFLSTSSLYSKYYLF